MNVKMMNVKVLFLLLLFFAVTSSVKHLLKFFFTSSNEVPDFPEFVAVGSLNEVQVGFCNSNMKKVIVTAEWMTEFLKIIPTHQEFYSAECLNEENFFRVNIEALMQRFNQSGGVHVLQSLSGCEWDDETEEVVGFLQYGYDGEDFIALDMQTLTWVAQSPRASITKMRWDSDKDRLNRYRFQYLHLCPTILKMYVHHGGSSLDRTELPSVSLLQKNSSSPITCHAAGFYPNSAVLFWRKDGKELFEEVVHGETLPNPDGSFQTSVDLKLPSEPPADWGRYECVFQLAGVEEDQVTRLDKEAIMTNEGCSSETHVGLLVGLIVGFLLLISVCVAGVFVWRKHNQGFQSANNEQPTPEESEHLEATNQ